MIQLFQKRDFGDKINVTFQYVTQNFQSLGLALLYIVGPVALIAGIASGMMQSDVFDLMKTSKGEGYGGNIFNPFIRAVFSPAFGISILFSLLAILAVSLATYAHMKLYARKATPVNPETPSAPVEISVSEVWEEMQPTLGRGILISILSFIVTCVASLLFVIPGIYVGIVLSLGLVVTLFEGTDFGQTWNRCFTLIRDKWWSTLGLIMVMSIISGIVGAVFTLPAAVINFLTASKLLPDLDNFWIVLGNVVSAIGGTILRTLVYVGLGFQYTNLVERQEGRGLLSAIDSIGTTPTRPRASDEGTY